MTLLRHELRQGRLSFWIWTGIIAFLMAVCIFLFPEMKGEMDGVSELFASMGSFTAAFGMDKINCGTLIGFYAVECGNILGLGGAFFAALMAVSVLAKEEKEGTADFLLSHPLSRSRVLTEKLLSVLLQILGLNALVFALSLLAIAGIGEDIPWKELGLLHLAHWLLQMEVAGICFGISAFLSRGGLGIGLGLAAMLYFLNIIANLSEQARFLRYLTPFAYAEGSEIAAKGALELPLVLVGLCFGAAGTALAYWRYTRKDIR